MSANTGILTYNNGFYQSRSIFYAPSTLIATSGEPLASYYCFLSRVIPWTNEVDPPAPTQDMNYIKQTFKNMFVAKKINGNDISPVIERINWESGQVYDYYQDNADMFEMDENGALVKHFYVKNRFDQVFKCLWNNNGGASTSEPYFEPGTFNSNAIYQSNDMYKWKYMYTITSGTKLKFMDETWMPVPVGSTTPNPVSTFAGSGSIDVINVTNGGSNYDPANAIITVVVTGSNTTPVSANVVISGNTISDITIANTGANYGPATVSIVSNLGSGATAIAPVSPVGGHGYNPASELGARHVMLTCLFEGSENGNIPTDIDYRQMGLLINPFAYFGTSVGMANGVIYKTTTDFIVSPGFGKYVPDEIAYESPDGTLASASFTSTVLSFDEVTNTLKVINTSGTPTTSAIIYGNNSKTARVVTQIQNPTLVPFSGFITYVENREPVQRDTQGSEKFKLVLGY